MVRHRRPGEGARGAGRLRSGPRSASSRPHPKPIRGWGPAPAPVPLVTLDNLGPIARAYHGDHG
uniref:Uncharacterized protein n=1 Tax=Cyprinus carpio carpio TaxID=630221 RepID=A0A9J8CWS6_CYPCA